MTVIETALQFAEAINSGEADQLSELMTEGHTFVDSDGSEHSGRQEMRVGWDQYFSMVPDFRIHVEHSSFSDNTVALFGRAEGTFIQNGTVSEVNHWEVPAAWRVVVENNRVAIWHLYVNPQPMIEIYNRIHAE